MRTYFCNKKRWTLTIFSRFRADSDYSKRKRKNPQQNRGTDNSAKDKQCQFAPPQAGGQNSIIQISFPSLNYYNVTLSLYVPTLFYGIQYRRIIALIFVKQFKNGAFIQQQKLSQFTQHMLITYRLSFFINKRIYFKQEIQILHYGIYSCRDKVLQGLALPGISCCRAKLLHG